LLYKQKVFGSIPPCESEKKTVLIEKDHAQIRTKSCFEPQIAHFDLPTYPRILSKLVIKNATCVERKFFHTADEHARNHFQHRAQKIHETFTVWPNIRSQKSAWLCRLERAPSRMALKPGVWLVGAAFLPAVSAWARSGDRQALRTLYDQMGGEHWAQDPELFGSDPYMAQNWTGGNNFWNVIEPTQDPAYEADPCQEKLTSEGLIADWFGVSCEDPCYAPIDGDDCRFGRITSIHLPGNNLTGTIPWQIFDSLVNLTIVDLSHNDISGTIPTEVGKLRNIKCAWSRSVEPTLHTPMRRGPGTGGEGGG
jgi:hypothetical protein